jgi:hypothetical protein
MPDTRNVYSGMAPGLEQVVYAGDTLVMKDNDGNEFAVSAKEGQATMDFLKAFDEWFMARERGGFSEGILLALWSEVKRTFNDLPMSIQRELPSIKHAGVVVPSYPHG